ncbi:hypothetical protein ACHAXT_013200 [Thalassiosira profunda]
MASRQPSRKRTISEADEGGADRRLLDGSMGLRRRRVGDSQERTIPGLSKRVSMDDAAPRPAAGAAVHRPTPPSAASANNAAMPTTQQRQVHQPQPSVVPLSMQLMRPFWAMAHCPDCARPAPISSSFGNSFHEEFFAGTQGYASRASAVDSCPRNVSMASLNNGSGDGERGFQSSGSSLSSGEAPSTKQSSNDENADYNPNVLPPTPAANALVLYSNEASIELILHEYTTACHIFGCSDRVNAGVLATFRFSLPTLRVSGHFFDADMLALTEVLLKHCNGALRYIKRLDFTVAGKEGKYGGVGRKGLRSHGACALSKVLAESQHIEEVYLTGNRIGPYGSAAIFAAAARNGREGGALRTLLMRGCRVGERGALAFAEEVCAPPKSEDGGVVKGGLEEVDLSACRIGFAGCYAIEQALKERAEALDGGKAMQVDLEGNLIVQEIANCVTHGLGILLGTVGTFLLTRRVSGQPSHYTLSCAIYCASLITLYTSSTLYHSFFALRMTRFIFKVFDRCAIYLLIAGSYTPFLMIALHHEPLWSLHLLLFIWTCAISGIVVEATMQKWEHKSKFSLAMYLGMGWSCLVCLPDLVEVLPKSAMGLMVAGGVAYTGGVPFFVRNNNLDHSIWHLFVLAGSIFHWLCVYWHVANPTK